MAPNRTKVPPKVGNAIVAAGAENPAAVGDVVATVYTDNSSGIAALYVEPLPPQSLNCVGPADAVGCPVSRVWYGAANITPQQQARAEWSYRSPDLDRNYVLVVGHLATVTVRDHRAGRSDDSVQQMWFVAAMPEELSV
jgi:hypothetical protein